MKQLKVPFKTDKQCEEEIDSIMSGKKKGIGPTIIRQFIKSRQALGEDKEFIRMMLIAEYKQKYGELQTGKKTIEQIKNEAEADSKKAGTEL